MPLVQLQARARRRSLVLFASLGLLLVACGGDGDEPADPVVTATAAVAATTAHAVSTAAATTVATEVATPAATATAAPSATPASTVAPTATAAPTAAPTAEPAPASSAAAEEHATDIAGFAFASEIRVAVGDSVVWTNQDGVPHTVTADDRAVDSGFLEQGGTVQLTFNQAGTFSYFCRVHPATMHGVVIVGDGGGSTTPSLGAVAAGTASDIDY